MKIINRWTTDYKDDWMIVLLVLKNHKVLFVFNNMFTYFAEAASDDYFGTPHDWICCHAQRM